MRRSRLTFVIGCVLIAASGCYRPRPLNPATQPALPSATHTEITGRVVRIADGDTVTVLDFANVQHRIRLQGIDAPESRQAYGAQAKQNLSTLIFDKEVKAICDKTDQYQRLVCKIVLDGRDINLEQIKAGLAWHYKDYEREQSPEDRELYAGAEDEARAARRGLWADANPIEPSEFRRDERRGREGR